MLGIYVSVSSLNIEENACSVSDFTFVFLTFRIGPFFGSCFIVCFVSVDVKDSVILFFVFFFFVHSAWLVRFFFTSSVFSFSTCSQSLFNGKCGNEIWYRQVFSWNCDKVRFFFYFGQSSPEFFRCFIFEVLPTKSLGYCTHSVQADSVQWTTGWDCLLL